MEIHYTNQNNNQSGNYGCLAQTIIMTLSLMVVGLLLPGVHITSVLTAVLAALVISLLNNFLRPILLVLSIPFTIVTMGLFIFVINAVIIWLASKLVTNFVIDSFGTALLAALIITAINYLLELPNRLSERHDYNEHNNDDDDDSDLDEFIEYEEVLDKDDD
ncbi:MAG: phage holin family protein [Bacteroidales bacterium]|nr:phage holin family protein [Bacteroidales bacterium]